MSKVLAITSGKNTPSSRYRMRQHYQGLMSKGIDVEDSCPYIDKNKSIPLLEKISPKYYLPLYGVWQAAKVIQRLPSVVASHFHDKVWLNRELVTGYYTLEPLLKRNIILDVDDAIWLNPPFGDNASKKIAKISQTIICGNSYLANWFSDFNKNCVIIPTSVDTNYLCPPQDRGGAKRTLNIGWIGTHGNLKYVNKIIKPIINILDKYEHVNFVVISDSMPEFLGLHDSIHFKYWSSIDEQNDFQSIDIGIMPLPDTEWAKGKCSYKLLQHMSCGSPVIGSPIGMNKSILLEKNGTLSATVLSDWYHCLEEFVLNDSLRTEYGNRSRSFIVNNYSNEIIQNKLSEVLS